MQTIILRHRRENLKKCSLRGLETHPTLRFYTYPQDPLPDFSGYLLLAVDAPVLSEKDSAYGLLLLDATWRLALHMQKQLPSSIPKRSLPLGFQTAYPRRQTNCPNPSEGLASIEALFLAHTLLGRSTEDFFQNYFWKDRFFSLNKLSSLTLKDCE